MVPHRQALRAISLVALSSPDPQAAIDRLCKLLGVKFPDEPTQFIESDVFPGLTAEVEALFRTTDSGSTFDFRPLFIAARQLGVQKYITVDETGPNVYLPPVLAKWRENSTVSQFLETCLLCGIANRQVADDMQRMFGISVDEDDVYAFGALFMDRNYVQGNCWYDYMRCIGPENAKFMRKLMDEPHDFVRWKLGVPVALNSDQVLDRLISDAYYTERLIKHEKEDHGVVLCKTELERVRMERDTIFKAMACRIKLKETTSAAGSVQAASAAAQEIRRIVLEFSNETIPLKSDIVGSRADLIAELRGVPHGSDRLN